MKLLFFDDFRLGVLKGDAVVDVSDTVKDIPHTGPHNLISGLIERFADYKARLEGAAANAPTANVAGTWTGNAGTGGVSAPVTLTLTQSGTNVSGNISVGGRIDLSGPVKGTVQGEIVKLSLPTVTLGQMIAKDGTMTGEVSGGLPARLRKVQ